MMTTQTTRLIPAAKWNDFHPWPPKGGLRHLIFHEKSNGFEKVVRRIGRRVLIDEAQFFEWAENTGGPQRGNLNMGDKDGK
jgi:hypothetical protein